MGQVRQGGARVITVELLNDAGALTDPSSIAITIIDNAGALAVSAAAMTKISTGLYQYGYQLAGNAALGGWTMFFTVTDTSGLIDKTEAQNAFEVVS